MGEQDYLRKEDRFKMRKQEKGREETRIELKSLCFKIKVYFCLEIGYIWRASKKSEKW